MGMLFARRKRNKVEGITTTDNLLQKEPKRVESVKPKVANNVPAKQDVEVKPNSTQPKFKV
jgi:hypothetical protein